jgi:hypothetical protein
MKKPKKATSHMKTHGNNPYELRILGAHSDTEWDGFVEKTDGGEVFHTSVWLKLCEHYQGARLVRLGFFENNTLVAVFLLFLRRYVILKVACSPFLLGSPMGPVISKGLEVERFWDNFDGWLARSHINFARVLLPPSYEAPPFQKRGYVCVTKPTHILDLTQGEEAIWRDMKGPCRTAIRKAEKSGVTLRFEEGQEFLDRYYEMAEALYDRKGQAVHSVKPFYAALLGGPMREKARLAVASLDGKDIAAAICLHYKGAAHYWDGVSDKDYDSYRPNNAIQWFIIRWAIKNKYASYDFVRSDFPSIAKFKANFGGEVRDYLLIEKTRPAALFPLRTLYGTRLKPWYRGLAWKLRSRDKDGNEDGCNHQL